MYIQMACFSVLYAPYIIVGGMSREAVSIGEERGSVIVPSILVQGGLFFGTGMYVFTRCDSTFIVRTYRTREGRGGHFFILLRHYVARASSRTL